MAFIVLDLPLGVTFETSRNGIPLSSKPGSRFFASSEITSIQPANAWSMTSSVETPHGRVFVKTGEGTCVHVHSEGIPAGIPEQCLVSTATRARRAQSQEEA
jgi:hypothetical protein